MFDIFVKYSYGKNYDKTFGGLVGKNERSRYGGWNFSVKIYRNYLRDYMLYPVHVDNQKAGIKMIEWIVSGIFCLCVGAWGLYLTRKTR